MPRLKLADGTILDAPDNPTPDDLAKISRAQVIATQRASGQPVAAAPGDTPNATMAAPDVPPVASEPGFWDFAKRGAGAILSGPAFIADIVNGDPDPSRTFAQSQALAKFGAQPKSEAGKLLQSGLEGASAAIGPGMLTSPLRTAAIGAMSGVGGELGKQALGGTGMPGTAGAIGGSTLGGLGAALTAGRLTNAPEIAREVLQGVDPRDLKVAGNEMQGLQRQGLSANLSQTMPNSSNIDELVSTLANTSAAKKTIAGLRAQPRQVDVAADNWMASVPGQVKGRQDIANNVQEALTQHFQSLKSARTESFKKVLGKGDQTLISPETMASVDGKLAAIADQWPNTGLADTINGLRKGLRDPRAAPDVVEVIADYGTEKEMRDLAGWTAQAGGEADPVYLQKVQEINRMLRSQTAGIRSPNLATKPMDAEEVGVFTNAVGMVRDELKAASPKFKAAYADYAAKSVPIDAMRKSVLGRIAGRGANDIDEATRDAAFHILDQGVSPNLVGKSEVEQLYKTLNKQNPDTFPDLVKTWLDGKLNKVSRPAVAQPAEDIAANMRKALFYSQEQKKGLQVALQGVEAAYGLKPNTLGKGLNNFIGVVEAAARRPARVMGVNQQGILETASSSMLANAMKFLGYSPFRTAAVETERYVRDKSLSTLDGLVNSPEGVSMLQDLAKEPVMSRKAEALVASFLAGNFKAQEVPTNNASGNSTE